MLFHIAGGVSGAFLALKLALYLGYFQLLLKNEMDLFTLIFSLVLLLVLAMAVGIGIAVGELISSIVGHYLPQTSAEQIYKLGSLSEETRTEHKWRMYGKNMILVPHVYTAYEYTIWDGKNYQPRSLRTHQAGLVFHNKKAIELVVKTYAFPVNWWNWLASSSATEYTFYAPRGKNV